MCRQVWFLAREFSSASMIAQSSTNGSDARVQSLIRDGFNDLEIECHFSAADSIRCGDGTLSIKYMNSLVTHGIPSDNQSGQVSRKEVTSCRIDCINVRGTHFMPIYALSCQYQHVSMRSL